jgi:hypothetical protein
MESAAMLKPMIDILIVQWPLEALPAQLETADTVAAA